MTNETWTRYLRATTESDNDITVAEKVGVSSSTIGRWKDGKIDPKPRQVVALARAYGKNPLGALIAAGYLEQGDIEGEVHLGIPFALDAASTFELLEEVEKRVELMGDVMGWLRSIGRNEGSPANLAADALRYVDPATPPVEADGEVYLRALDEHVVQTGEYEGEALFGLRTPYVPTDELALRRGVAPSVDDDLKKTARPAETESGDDPPST